MSMDTNDTTDDDTTDDEREKVTDRAQSDFAVNARRGSSTVESYESEGNEFPVLCQRGILKERKQLKKDTIALESTVLPADESFFTHLRGNEAEVSMRSKYGKYRFESQSMHTQAHPDLQQDIKEKDNNRLPSVKPKRMKKGKLNVSVQRKKKVLNASSKRGNVDYLSRSSEDEELDGKTEEESSTSSNGIHSKSRTAAASFVDSIIENGQCDMIAGGFDDQDMEKPCFAEDAPHSSVPLLLSEPGKLPEIQVPATVNRYLRDYQRDGVCFLYKHYSENAGAILGDDMGLGKTVQVIAFIAAILRKTGTKADIFSKFMHGSCRGNQDATNLGHPKGAFLIVSPGSVMYNWKDELETWGHFKTGLFHASSKGATLERALKGSLDVVLTTYETLRNHLDDLNRIEWLAVIMDEVHRLKEPKAQVTIAAKALHVKRRYGLTGTPLQNSLEEFWCVLDWANPGCLGTRKKFDVQFGKPIRRGQSFEVTKRELALGRKRSKELQDKLGKWFLRRTKDLLTDQLPKKDELVMFCPLMPFQEDVYQTLLQHPDVELVTKKDFPCDCGSGEDRGKCCHKFSSEKEGIKATTLKFFQLLLKVANHAALLAPTVKQTPNQRQKAQDICQRVFVRYPEFTGITEVSSFELLSDPKYCGKMKVLDKLLRVFQGEHSKVLLFSRSTQLLNILEEFVISRGLVYRRLDGGTKAAERTRLVLDFNRDPGIFLCLVSTKAGSLGLNFTGANVVIIFDPTWNPSNDLQAQDRAYRIGQRRDVRVYRLISSGTIEEMMYLRQVYKQQLANIAVGGTNERRYFTGVDGEKDRKGELFGIENLFSYRAEGASLSKDIVKRTERLEAGYTVAQYELLPQTNDEDDPEKASNNLGKQINHKDPCNLEEIASQLVDDNTNKKRSRHVTDSEGTHYCELDDYKVELTASSSDASNVEGQTTEVKELAIKESNEDGKDVPAFNDDSLFTDEDTPSSAEHSATNAEPAGVCRATSVKERGLFDLFSSSEDEDLGERCKFTRIRGRRKAVRSQKYSLDDFSEDDSCDVVPPTASLNRVRKTRKQRKAQTVERKAVTPNNWSSSICDSSSELSDLDECLPSKTKSEETSKALSRKKVAIVASSNKALTIRRGKARCIRVTGRKGLSSVPKEEELETVERSKKDDALQRILESCGIRYTHVSGRIVGPSEAENHMSKQALQDVFELRQFSQQPANCLPALETSGESDDLGMSTQDEKPVKPDIKKHGKQRDTGSSNCQQRSQTNQRTNKILDDVLVEDIGNFTVFIGSTPRGIRRQQFRQMSVKLGFSSEVDFAESIIESSELERRAILKRFYLDQNPSLSGLSSFSAGKDCVTKERGKKHEKREVDRGKTSNRTKGNFGKRGLKRKVIEKSKNDRKKKPAEKTELRSVNSDVTEFSDQKTKNVVTPGVKEVKYETETSLAKSENFPTEIGSSKNGEEHGRTRKLNVLCSVPQMQKSVNKLLPEFHTETKLDMDAPDIVAMEPAENVQTKVKTLGSKPFVSVSVLDEFLSPVLRTRDEESREVRIFRDKSVDRRTCERKDGENRIDISRTRDQTRNITSVLQNFI